MPNLGEGGELWEDMLLCSGSATSLVLVELDVYRSTTRSSYSMQQLANGAKPLAVWGRSRRVSCSALAGGLRLRAKDLQPAQNERRCTGRRRKTPDKSDGATLPDWTS